MSDQQCPHDDDDRQWDKREPVVVAPAPYCFTQAKQDEGEWCEHEKQGGDTDQQGNGKIDQGASA
jgi:hypothetical protein